MSRIGCAQCLFALYVVLPVFAQQTAANSASPAVPLMVNFSGSLSDESGKALTGIVGLTFSLYRDQQGGAPLWLETQNVQPDRNGRYSVILGSTTSNGLPTNVFASGEARWLGVQVQGSQEQPRVLLLAVPYALKALDAETIGGKPASAFALANPATSAASGFAGQTTAQHAAKVSPSVGGSGTTGYIAEWTATKTLGNSALFQTTGGNLGIATTTPGQKLEVDSGNILVTGSDNFAKKGDTANLFVGDTNHTFQATHGSGLTLGTYKVPAAIFIQDKTGYVGMGTGTSAPVAHLDVTEPTRSAIYGDSVNASQTGALVQPTSGLWGDTGVSGNLAIVGTADDGYPVVGFNNSPSGNPGIIVEGFDATNSTGLLLDAYSAGFGGECTVDVNGNLTCTGNITPAVAIDGGSRKVALNSIAAAEEWFEDAGNGKLTNGSAAVHLDPTFAQTVNSNVEYHVFLTPKGDCEGLYVSNETTSGFEVRELRHGRSNVGFDYRIMAKRRGHENIRLADRTRELEPPRFKHESRAVRP